MQAKVKECREGGGCFERNRQSVQQLIWRLTRRHLPEDENHDIDEQSPSR